ncbi:MAG: ATP-binding cassette domain-containing protein [Peptococcaceae bacterium]|nr:ATP-binding cassette domain-containing protein [Peptococcaceae bacterium]
MLSCQNLQLIYQDGQNTKTVFDQMNLKITRGENVVLLGPSGSGKSSLIYLLSCLRKPTDGKIFLDDICISELSPEEIADIRKERFAFVFQMHFLVPYLTAVENVMTGRGDFSEGGREKAMALLAELGLEGHADKDIHHLSGGEQQQIAIARALISDPDIIFADEPTASLDHETARGVLQFLKNHKSESTLIFATHDTSILAGDERILYLENAKVVEADFEGGSGERESCSREAGFGERTVSSGERTRFLTRLLHPEQGQRKTGYSNEGAAMARKGSARIRENPLADMERIERKTSDSHKGSARIRERSLADMERVQHKPSDSHKGSVRVRERSLADMERAQRRTSESHKGSVRIRERSLADMERVQRKTSDSQKESAHIRERSLADMERAQRKTSDSQKEPARIHERSLADMERVQRKTSDSQKEPARIHERSLADMERVQRKNEKIEQKNSDFEESVVSAHAAIPVTEQAAAEDAVTTKTGERSVSPSESAASARARIASARARVASVRERAAGFRTRTTVTAAAAETTSTAAETTSTAAETVSTATETTSIAAETVPTAAETVSTATETVSTATETTSIAAETVPTAADTASAAAEAVSAATVTAGTEEKAASSKESAPRSAHIRENSLADMEKAQRNPIDSGENVTCERGAKTDERDASSGESDVIIREKVLADMEKVPRKGLNASERAGDTYEKPDTRKRYFANLDRKQQTAGSKERVDRARANGVLARTAGAKERAVDPNESVAIIRERVLADMGKDQQQTDSRESAAGARESAADTNKRGVSSHESIAMIREIVLADMGKRKRKAEAVDPSEDAADADESAARIRERAFEDMERRRVERRLAELERLVENME